MVSLFNATSDVLPKEQQRGPTRLLGRREEELIVEWLLENAGIYLDESQVKLLQSTGIFINLATIYRPFSAWDSRGR